MGLNTELMSALARLHHRAETGTVRVQEPGKNRVLQVLEGQLVVVGSDVPEERIGEFLAREGLVDAALIEPLTAEAKRRNQPLGAQLIAEGLLKPADLAAAVERQALLRFDRAMTMAGQVTLTADKPGGPQVMKRWLGSVVLAAFRDRLAADDIRLLVRERKAGTIALDMASTPFAQLGLLPAELRICRRLSTGASIKELAGPTTSPEQIVRLLGALVALGHWS